MGGGVVWGVGGESGGEGEGEEEGRWAGKLNAFVLAFRGVQTKQANGGLAFAGERDDEGAIPAEMMEPDVCSRIEQGGDFSVIIETGNVGALCSIAGGAGVGEIFKGGRAAMFFTDDVIHFAAEEGVALGDLAILTAVGCAFGDLKPEFAVDP